MNAASERYRKYRNYHVIVLTRWHLETCLNKDLLRSHNTPVPWNPKRQIKKHLLISKCNNFFSYFHTLRRSNDIRVWSESGVYPECIRVRGIWVLSIKIMSVVGVYLEYFRVWIAQCVWLCGRTLSLRLALQAVLAIMSIAMDCINDNADWLRQTKG